MQRHSQKTKQKQQRGTHRVTPSRYVTRPFIFVLLCISYCFLAGTSALGQTPTLVTGTAKDSSGFPYSFARVAASLNGCAPAGCTITLGGIPVQIQGQQNATADVNGNFTMNLFCNSAGGGCSVISPASTTWTFTINEIGIAPPAGTGPQACSATLTITGSSQNVSSSFGACPALSNSNGGLSQAAPSFGIFASPQCPASGFAYCVQLPASGGMLWDCSWTTSSTTITCPDGIFTPSMFAGGSWKAFGTNVCPSGGPCEITSTVIVPEGTPTYGSSTTITMSTTPTVNCTANLGADIACLLIWYQYADTQLSNAWALSGQSCVPIRVADGIWGISNVNFNSTGQVCPPGVGEGKTGVGLVGNSSSSATMILAPALTANLTAGNCNHGTSGKACFGSAPGIILQHIKFFGGGNSLNGQSHPYNLFEINTNTNSTASLLDVIFGGYGGGDTTLAGFVVNGATPEPFLSIQSLGFGGTNCLMENVPWGMQAVQMNCEDALTNNLVLTNVQFQSNNSTFGTSTTSGKCSVLVNSGAIWMTDGEMLDYGNLVNPPTGHKGLCNNGTVYANHLTIREGTATSGLNDAIWNGYSAPGAVLYLRDSIILGGTSGTAYGIYGNNVNTIFEQGVNTITGATAPLGQASSTYTTVFGDGSATGIPDTQSNHVLTSGWGTGTAQTFGASSNASSGASNVTTQTCTLTNSTGDAEIIWINYSNYLTTVASVTGGSVTWTPLTAITYASQGAATAWVANGLPSGSNTITVTLNSGSTFLYVGCERFTNVGGFGNVASGTVVTATGSTGVAPSTANLTIPSGGGIAAFVGIAATITETAGSGFTIDTPGSNGGNWPEYLVAGTSGSKAVAFGTNANASWGMIAVVLYPSGVTAVSGSTRSKIFTINSTGTGQTSSPVLTESFPPTVPGGFLLTPSGGCTLNQIGGTFGDISNPVASSLSSSGVTWTFTGTPVAGHSYIFREQCSNP